MLYILMSLTLIIAGCAYFFSGGKITNKELLVQLGIVNSLLVLFWVIGNLSLSLDTEILNGKVVDKQRNRVSCEHSYSCNCRQVCSGSGDKKTCSTVCQTCYEHSYDVDWDVYTSVGNFSIEREDRQGLIQPKRYTDVIIGEPAAREHIFRNYIKAAKDSLFNNKEIESKYSVPDYPSVFDYYRANNVIVNGNPHVDVKSYNTLLRDQLKVLGAKKQVNIILIFTSVSSQDYAVAVRNKWLGGKKNDVVVVIGTQDGKIPMWANVFSWSTNDLVNTTIRNDVIEQNDLTPEKLVATISTDVNKHFVRKPMEDYEYLKNSVEPPLWCVILCVLITVGGSVGLSVFFYKRNVF